MKHWVTSAVTSLEESLSPTPHELNELDWKLSLSDDKERLGAHIMAFANYSGGGVLVLGVDDSGRVVGISQEASAKAVATLTNLGREAVEPPVAIDHSIVEFRGGPILLVRVPEQPTKPVHRRGKSIEDTWIRSGGTTRKASRQEVGGLMLNSSVPHWEDLRASELLTAEEVVHLLDLETIARLLERRVPDSVDGQALWAAEHGLLRAEGSGFYVTNFGAIAAARNLENFPGLVRKRIRLIRYRGTNKVNTIDETDGQKGYAAGFELLIRHLKRVLPHSEVIQQSLRTEVCIYPEIALREMVANALIHQDFGVTGAGPLVEIFDDRIEVTNPGSLLPSKRLDRLIGTNPESRNERLASSFRLFRICEERGTGFQKMVQEAELFGLPPLLLTPLDNAFRVTLGSPRAFSDMSAQERIEATYQHAVLQYLSSQTLTNTTLRKRFKVHEKQRNQISNIISDAVDAARIKRKDEGGGTKFAEYVPYWA